MRAQVRVFWSRWAGRLLTPSCLPFFSIMAEVWSITRKFPQELPGSWNKYKVRTVAARNECKGRVKQSRLGTLELRRFRETQFRCWKSVD